MIRHDPQRAAYEQGCSDTIERIADELDRMADAYLPVPDGGVFDIWEFSAMLAKKVRAGDLTQPLPSEPPW